MTTNTVLVLILLLCSMLSGCGTLGSGLGGGTPQQQQQNGQALQETGIKNANDAAARGDNVGATIGLGTAIAGLVIAVLGHLKNANTQGQVDQLYDATHMPIAQPPASPSAPPAK